MPSPQLAALSLFVAGAIFVFDLLLPLGVAGGVPYVALVFLGIWFPERTDLYRLAAVASTLIVIGFFLSPTGSVGWVVLTNRSLALFAVWITAILIAEWKRAEAAAAGKDAWVRAIVDTAVDAIVTIDSKGLIESLNPAAERIFGHRPEDVIGRNVNILMPPRYANEHDEYIANYLGGGEAKIIGIGREVEGLRKDGTVFPLHLSVSEFSDGGERKFAGILHDISERKNLEARARETETQLRHVSRLSDMGQMASALAHEINQPLTAAGTYTQAARRVLEKQDLPVSETVYDNLDKATAQGTRAAEVIRRLRRFIEKKDSPLSNESLNDVVKEAADLALVDARETGVNVLMNLDSNLPRIPMDRISIQQVVVNLVRNGIEALPESGHREITVRTAMLGDDIEVAVSDTGAGLSEDVAGQLFQPFVTTKDNGMGVGLSICRAIVEEHGGEITATSNPGGGTIFSFTLPVISDTGNGHE